MSIYDQLEDEISARFTKLRTEKLSAEDDRVEVENLAKLMNTKIEMDRAENEKLVKKQQLKDEMQGRWIVAGMGLAGTLITLGFSYRALDKTIEFEKTGAFTTIFSRGLAQGFIPKIRNK